jgi:bile acid-coenzyme A ligase
VTTEQEQISYGRRLTMLASEHAVDDVAVVFAAENGDERPITWRELEGRANQVAHFLAGRGVGQDDIVVVALRNSPEHLFSTFGSWKLGASVLPLRWDLPEWERDRMLAVADGKVVVAEWENAAPATVTPAELGTTTSLSSDPPEPDRIPPYTRLIATSGATGSPKIVVTPSPGVMAADEQMSSVMLDSGGKRYLTTSPLYHVNGFAYAYNPLLQDSPIVLMERFDAARAVDLIERYRVAYTVMVPTMLLRIARLEDVRSRDFSSIERIVYGGASIPEWVVRAWFELVPPERFVFSYGGSEGHGLVMTTGDQWLEHPGTVGKPLLGEAKILDEDGNEVPTGEIGEIFLRGDATGPRFRYIGQPTPDAAPGGFGSFGDMGYVDEDGFIFIADRRRDMIVSGGANVYPAEVEAVITEHDGVLDVVVVGLPDPEWGHRVHAIVEASDPAHAPTADELRAHCKARLTSYKVPKSFETIERIPRSAAGKVNRSALVDERASGQLS